MITLLFLEHTCDARSYNRHRLFSDVQAVYHASYSLSSHAFMPLQSHGIKKDAS